MRNLKKVLSVLLVVVIMATAMVPAFAADTYTYSAQANALNKIGLFNGTSSTEFVPDLGSSLTREQGIALVVRLIGKASAAAALTATEADAALAAFGDAKDVEPTLKNAVAYAVKNNLVIGTDAKLLAAKSAMSGNDLATIILRNIGYAVDAAGYSVATATLADKGGLTAAEATKFATKALIRDDAVGIMYGSLFAKYSNGTTVIAKLIADKAVVEADAIAAGVWTKPVAGTVSATVTGAKKFTLTFSAAIDTAKVTAASVTVKKGASTYNVESFVVAADKKSAVVTIGNPIVKGDYEISVTGIADAAVVAKVTAENERLDKIQFASENAVLGSATDFTKVNVSYKVLNQYGEDVTTKKWSLVTFEASKGTKNITDGKIELSVATANQFTIGEKLTVTGTYVDTDNNKSVFASAVLTVSQMAQVGEITITDLYNANKDTLDINASFSDFKLLVDAKDQYGNKIPYGDLANALVMQSTDTSVARIAGSFEQVTIDGVKKTALSLNNGTSNDAPTNLQKAGTTTIMLVSKYSGKMAQFTVTVKDAQKIDTLTIQSPDYPVAGEKVKIPFTALDQDGNEITKLSGLVMNSNPAFSVSGDATASAAFEQDSVTGKPVLVLDASQITEKKTLYITGTTATYKFVNFPINLQAPATLESVSGFKSSLYYNMLAGNYTTDFKYDNVLVKDSYGRDVTKDQLALKYTLGTGYRFTLESSDASKIKITGTETTVGSGVYTMTTTGTTVFAVEKGSATITLELQKWDSTNSEWDYVSDTSFSINAIEKKDIQSYTATNIASLYTTADAYTSGSSHYKEVKVEGVLANGKKVLVPRQIGNEVNYYVTTSAELAYAPATVSNNVYGSGKVYSVKAVASDEDDVNASYTVTVLGYNKTEMVSVATKVSGATPTASAIILYVTTDIFGTYPKYVKESDTVASIDLAKAGTETAVKDLVPSIVKFTDQYGIKMTPAYLSTYIKDIIVSNVKNTDNEVVSTTTYAAGYSVYVSVITADGKSFGFTLAIK